MFLKGIIQVRFRVYSTRSIPQTYQWYYRLIPSNNIDEANGKVKSIADIEDNNKAPFSAFSLTDCLLLESQFEQRNELMHKKHSLKHHFMKRSLNIKDQNSLDTVYLKKMDLYFCDINKMLMFPIYWGSKKNSSFEEIYEIRRGKWVEATSTSHEKVIKVDGKKQENKSIKLNVNKQNPIPSFISDHIESIIHKDNSYLKEEKLISIPDLSSNSKKIIGKVFMPDENTMFFIPREHLMIYDNLLTLKLVKENVFKAGLRKFVKQDPIDSTLIKQLEKEKKKKINSRKFIYHSVFMEEDMHDDVKLQVLPITWRDKLNFDHPTNDNNLPSFSEICPTGATTIRSLIGDIGLDILLYDDVYYQQQIIDAVINELNDKYEIYKKHHSNVEIEISLIGHSLGSLILFDILSNKEHYQKLKFDVSNFFGVGSPVSIFKLIQRYKFKNLACNNYFNIFHECDPIGYRIEPLIDRSIANVQPVAIATLSPPDIIIDKVKNINLINDYILGSDLIKNKAEIPNLKLDGKLKKSHVENMHKHNSLGRVDFVIKSKLLDLDVINALSSHVSYFENLDMIRFIIQKLLSKRDKLSLEESIKLNLK
ncbi:unnamed protein product [Hanseniaspora opuntiae]